MPRHVCQEEEARASVGIFRVSSKPAGYKHVMNNPGKPIPQPLQLSRKDIDFGDKIGSESFCVCVTHLSCGLGVKSLRLPKSLFSGKNKKNKHAFNKKIRNNIYKLRC